MFTPSSVCHKARKNMKLTNEEEAQVRSAMCEPFNKLEAVESETARLRDRLVVLNQKKKDTEHFIKVHRCLLSPIRRLHPDILQEIFCRCLPVAHNSVLSFKQAPLLLGQVCSQWRQVAHSTPALWSSLHINALALASPGARARFGIFDAWLARSGILPLSISISMLTTWDPDMFSQLFRPYFNLIAKYVRRWKHFHFEAPEECDPICSLMEINADDLPLLEVFHIEGGRPATSAYSKKGGIFSAPLLRDLSVYCDSVRLLDLPIVWSNLTGLDSSLSNLSDVFELLSLCSNLDTCTLRGRLWAPSSQPSNSWPRIVLPKLRTLCLYGVEIVQNDALFSVLKNLFAPALRHLSCQLCNWSPPSATLPGPLSPSEIFSSFFQRLNEPLEELDLRAAIDDGKTSDVIDLLSLCSGLKRLSLRSLIRCPKTSEFLVGGLLNDHLLLGFLPYRRRNHCRSGSLVEEPEEQVETDDSVLVSSTCLCPNLEVLNVIGADCSEHILLECLHSRLVDYDKYNIARLRRFRILSCRPTSEDDDMQGKIHRLAEKSGLQVKLELHSPAPPASGPPLCSPPRDTFNYMLFN